ncbi:MAG TPA: TylF/MycF/NovP-related O-methyltransferase [Stellaceae bacterium]
MAAGELRDRYLELLIRVLANTIYEDPPKDPVHPPVYNPQTRKAGGDWPERAHTMVGLTRLE